MPYDKETGEVYDTDAELGTDFEAEALRLSKEFEEVVEAFENEVDDEEDAE